MQKIVPLLRRLDWKVLRVKWDPGFKVSSNGLAKKKKYKEINVAKHEQFLNLGGGLILYYHCITSLLSWMFDIL